MIHYTIHYTLCRAVCFQFTHSPCDDSENIYTLSYHHDQIGSMNYYPLFRVRSWNNDVRCMYFYILMHHICNISQVHPHSGGNWKIERNESQNHWLMTVPPDNIYHITDLVDDIKAEETKITLLVHKINHLDIFLLGIIHYMYSILSIIISCFFAKWISVVLSMMIITG